MGKSRGMVTGREGNETDSRDDERRNKFPPVKYKNKFLYNVIVDSIKC